jgi:hypothetical protein
MGTYVRTPYRSAHGPAARRHTKNEALASGEFSTIRNRPLKIAVRVRETGTRIKLAFAANCPDAKLFRFLVGTVISRPT